jgi:hypothetical protein
MQPTKNTKAAEVAAGEYFRLAGPTGLEPATSGVTGWRSDNLLIGFDVYGESLRELAVLRVKA